MVKNNLIYIHHILESMAHIEDFLKQVNELKFSQDKHWQNAFIREIQVIGEAARHISADFQKQHSIIPWVDIIGMRHKLFHDYFEIDLPLVWDVATIDIPRLKPLLEQLLQ